MTGAIEKFVKQPAPIKVIRVESIHKASMKAAARNNGSWKGYVAPAKVNSYHVVNGWHIGYDIHVTAVKIDKVWNYMVDVGDVTDDGEDFINELMPLDVWLNDYMYYNCNSELGKRVRFWEVVK